MARVDEDESFRERVCAWLRANGVDPNRIPMSARASIADDKLTILQKLQIDGHDVIDPENPNEILCRTITVPVLVEPDREVAEWLLPRCPECGR